jgi:hypothetical protein
VAYHASHALAVRLTLSHLILRSAHFTGRHHLHGAGDLLCVAHTFDLYLNLFADCHSPIPLINASFNPTPQQHQKD